jgi:hypothetical protein
LGVDYLPARQQADQRRRAVQRLEAMGYQVILTPVAA